MIDASLCLAWNQSIASAGTGAELLESAVPIPVAGTMSDIGEPLEVVFFVDTAFASAAGMTVDFQVLTSDDAAGSNVVVQSALMGQDKTVLTAGKRIRLPIRLNATDVDSAFIMGRLTFNTTAPNAGAISAWIQRPGDDQQWSAKADNTN